MLFLAVFGVFTLVGMGMVFPIGGLASQDAIVQYVFVVYFASGAELMPVHIFRAGNKQWLPSFDTPSGVDNILISLRRKIQEFGW